jgi:hypothetical protein
LVAIVGLFFDMGPPLKWDFKVPGSDFAADGLALVVVYQLF